MSDEGRRVFSMETALGLVAGKGGSDVLDFMGYAVGRSVDEECRTALSPLVKGWLYSLNPDFMKAAPASDVGYEVWLDAQKKKFGDNLSISPMPAVEMAAVSALIDTVAGAKQTAEDKIAEAEEALAAKEAAESDAAALMPFKKKAEAAEKKAAQLEEKNSALAAELAELKEKLASFDGKVAIDENAIEKTVKDIVSKALSGIVVAGGAVAAGAVAAGDAAGAVAEEAGPAADADGVPDTFGFGASGSDGDGFGF